MSFKRPLCRLWCRQASSGRPSRLTGPKLLPPILRSLAGWSFVRNRIDWTPTTLHARRGRRYCACIPQQFPVAWIRTLDRSKWSTWRPSSRQRCCRCRLGSRCAISFSQPSLWNLCKPPPFCPSLSRLRSWPTAPSVTCGSSLPSSVSFSRSGSLRFFRRASPLLCCVGYAALVN